MTHTAEGSHTTHRRCTWFHAGEAPPPGMKGRLQPRKHEAAPGPPTGCPALWGGSQYVWAWTVTARPTREELRPSSAHLAVRGYRWLWQGAGADRGEGRSRPRLAISTPFNPDQNRVRPRSTPTSPPDPDACLPVADTSTDTLPPFLCGRDVNPRIPAFLPVWQRLQPSSSNLILPRFHPRLQPVSSPQPPTPATHPGPPAYLPPHPVVHDSHTHCSSISARLDYV